VCDWISGTLELTSKVRYGINSRGIPLFRFVPYARHLAPLAVSCSQRDLFYNVHAIVSAEDTAKATKGVLQRGNLIQNLGPTTPQTEVQVLLAAYAYDCKKSLRPSKAAASISTLDLTNRIPVPGFTFNIDPPGCKDVDDSFTVRKLEGNWHISINIADVAALIQEGSELDLQARQRATSFYSPQGEALAPMFPAVISESAASLGSDDPRPALSLQFIYGPDGKHSFKWVETVIVRSRSFTYDEADHLLHNYPELQVIKDLTGGSNSHEWVERLMILYNQKAGETLKAAGKGILRSHSAPATEELAQLTAIDPAFSVLAYDSATFCLPSDNTKHFGLNVDAYAYASSPIRRYCDLVNQRALKGLGQETEDLVYHLNRRQKQAKAFSRDLFFMTELANSKAAVEGTVIQSKEKTKVYVPAWKRSIKVRLLTDPPNPGTKVSIEWYDDRSKPNWKERIVFRLKNSHI